MVRFSLLICIILLFITCKDDSQAPEGGIPPGFRGFVNGLYWEADSTLAFKMSARSSTNPSIRTMLVVNGYRWVTGNYLNRINLTLHDDRVGDYSSKDKNLFVTIDVFNPQGQQTTYNANLDYGRATAEIFTVKDGIIEGHFNCAGVAVYPANPQDSVYIDGGNFSMTLEDRTEN